jgi:uncharacterized protein (DUF433 family)
MNAIEGSYRHYVNSGERSTNETLSDESSFDEKRAKLAGTDVVMGSEPVSSTSSVDVEFMPAFLLPPPDQDPSARVLIAALIDRTEGVVGGSTRIARTRIAIWTLENYRRLGWSEQQILEAYPSLRKADLRAAWAYVDAHGAEIDAEIIENEMD